MKSTPLLLTLALAVAAFAAPLISPRDDARRLEVLFFGAPTRNHPGHDPITRYRVLKKHLGDDGINLTYLEDPSEALDAVTLAHFDAVLMYGNWAQRGPMPAEQEKALVEFVERGGGFLPIHCASACYGKSEAFVKLVGGVFKAMGGAPAVHHDMLEGLTEREKDVALAVAEGQSNKLVARELGITERTVKAHLGAVFRKLGVKDRMQLILRLSRER